MTDETEYVQISREALLTLKNEAESFVESVNDEEWHDSPYGQEVHESISEAETALNSNNGIQGVQWGASLGLDGLDDEERAAEIVNRIAASGLRIGRAPGEEQYIINTSNDE